MALDPDTRITGSHVVAVTPYHEYFFLSVDRHSWLLVRHVLMEPSRLGKHSIKFLQAAFWGENIGLSAM